MEDNDTIERITRFLEGQEGLPGRVSNGMLLLAVRAVRDEVRETRRVLYGMLPDGSDGLIAEVSRLSTLARAVVWAASAAGLAFLGGLGMYIFQLLIQ